MSNLILLKDFLETQIELWRTVEDAPDYEVSNLGRVRSYRGKARGFGCRGGFKSVRLETPRIMCPHFHAKKTPYLMVMLQTDSGEKIFAVHRLVAKAFIPNPDNKPQINHLTAVRTDARAGNLEWSTHGENHEHATVYGLRPKGERHALARLTADDVRSIRQRVAQGETQASIAKEYNCTRQAVFRLVHRLNWKSVP